MAGEQEPVAVAGSAAGTPEPVAAPVVAAPAEPAPAPAPDPAPAPAPEAAPAPAEPAPALGAKPAAAAPEPTLLQKFDAEQAAAAPADKPADKPAEPAKPAAAAAPAADPAKPDDPAATAAPTEPAPAAEPAPLEPIDYGYTLPETIQMDDALKGTFHTALDAFRRDPSTGAQGLVDLHNQSMQQYAEQVQADQMKVWNDTRKDWQTQVMADEQLGGAGYQTTMGAVARMRDLLVHEKDRPAFDHFLLTTGAGDHPEFLRILHNAARLFDEAPLPPPEPRPAPNGGKPASGRLRDMYKSNQGR